MDVVIASNNAGKIAEIKEIFAGVFKRIYSLSDLNISMDVVEDGATFEENAIKKAVAVMNATGLPALADDSGLVVDALDGAPGVYSARFAGEKATDEENNKKLLSLMRGESNRQASFVCCVALARPGLRTLTAFGECIGQIADKPAGEGGFGYDPVFYVPEFGKTFAEMDNAQKNSISHRRIALQNLKEVMAEEKQSKRIVRIAVLSDTHGHRLMLEKAEKLAGRVDYVLHAGDGERDLGGLFEDAEIVRVAGNCDFGSKMKREELVTIKDKTILILHGNQYNLRDGLLPLILRAREVNADVVVFGHTHVSGIWNIGGVTLMNPGAFVRLPFGAKPTFGMIEIGRTPTFRLVSLESGN